jgi:two-component system sensor kinase
MRTADGDDVKDISLQDIFAYISKLKKAQDALKRSELRFRRLVEVSSQVIWLANAKGDIIEDSASWRNFTGRTFDQLAGWNWLASIHPDDRQHLEMAWRDCIRKATTCHVEFREMNADSQYRNIVGTAVPILDENGSILEWIGMNQDVTERKQAEEKVKKSLKEKELLLKEIHHRVKNNLQLISSLLHLQSLQTDIQSSEALKESRNRIRSIALVYEILYGAEDLSKISANEYLRKLVKSILDTSKGNISAKFDIDETSFEINKAITCGIIVNELVTNAIKHAFPAGEGNISVTLHTVGDKQELAIRDDGIGMPPNFRLGESKSLGLKLVKSLTEQLEGELEYTNGIGTELKISFK